MKCIKLLFPIFIGTLICATPVAAQIGQETGFDRQLREIDDQPLRGFVTSKEDIDLELKSRNLDLSGDVRFFWQNLQEKGLSLHDCRGSDSRRFPRNYRAFRGGSHVDRDGIPLSTNIFDVEFNLKIKYTFKDAWAMAQLQFDNPAGTRGSFACRDEFPVFNKKGSRVARKDPRNLRREIKSSGFESAINLKRAYIGYNIWADGKHRVDIEVGRRKMDDIFESEIEFANRFDGVLLKYATAFEEFADFYWNTGGFVIDQRVNHFGYVTEFGLLDIYDTGLELRYSFIDWRKFGKNRCFYRDPIGTDFANSQISFSYNITPELFCREIPVEIYGGFLVNHAAKKTRFSRHKKENIGWYAGLYVGNVDKKGDWAFDIEYISIQAQAVPDLDVASIGVGNIFRQGFFDVIERDSGSSGSGSSSTEYFLPRRGNANFSGWRFNFLYAFTDNLTADLVYQWSQSQNRRLGGDHCYHDFEMEIIYAF